MTRIEKGIVIIEPEAPARCQMCGNVDELRPYGPNGMYICFDCAMKDEEGAKKRFIAFLETARQQTPAEN